MSKAERHVEQSWFNGSSIEYETPDSIFNPLDNEFRFTLDVAATPENTKCPKFFTAQDDGLSKSWSGCVCWMNPPYGRIMQKWVRKAHSEWLTGTLIVALLPARTNTIWWHDCIEKKAEVRFIKGQVAFKGFKRGLWMPMCVVVWHPRQFITEQGRAVLV